MSALTNPLGQITSFEYDASGRVTKQILPGNRQIGSTFDKNGNLTSLTPAGRPAHQFSSDLLNQLVGYLSPVLPGNSVPVTYGYTSDREILEKRLPSGDKITFEYDPTRGIKDQPTTMVAGNETDYVSRSFGYEYGFLVGASSFDIITGENSFDSFTRFGGIITSERAQTAAYIPSFTTSTIDYTYNANRQIASATLKGPSTTYETINYFYDDDDLATGTNHLLVNRDPSTGLLAGSSLSGVSTAITRNEFGEPQVYEAKVGSGVLLRETYTRDKLGRISSKTALANGVTKNYTYEYDIAGRLFRARENGSIVGEYTYDLNGNRLTANVRTQAFNSTYDAQDRILSRGSTTYSHNLNGDLSAKTVGTDTTFYDFNSLSLLRFVRFQNGTTLRYAYDSEGRRTFQIVNDIAKQKFIYNFNDQIVAVVDENAKLTQFVYSTLSHSPDYMIQDGVKFRFIHDQIGSVRFVVNTSTNAVVQTVTYDEFGNVLTDSNPSLQPFRFAGCLYDTYTKLCRFGARDYDPETGRWLSKDPILFKGGDTNLYGYVLNDPVNMIDPDGKNGIVLAGALILTGILVHDAWNAYHDQPTICGKAADKLGLDLNKIPIIKDILDVIKGKNLFDALEGYSK
jgi:RHS repeat-associated protein